jgi:hypothetical protein
MDVCPEGTAGLTFFSGRGTGISFRPAREVRLVLVLHYYFIMNTDSNNLTSNPVEFETVPNVFCHLFSDTIPRHLCAIRRRELDGRGGFSCDDCHLVANATKTEN